MTTPSSHILTLSDPLTRRLRVVTLTPSSPLPLDETVQILKAQMLGWTEDSIYAEQWFRSSGEDTLKIRHLASLSSATIDSIQEYHDGQGNIVSVTVLSLADVSTNSMNIVGSDGSHISEFVLADKKNLLD